jgi:hypothetical protein
MALKQLLEDKPVETKQVKTEILDAEFDITQPAKKAPDVFQSMYMQPVLDIKGQSAVEEITGGIKGKKKKEL